MNWYEYPVCVPYGNPNYDAQLGGSHDMDVRTPLGTVVTALLSGTITDLSRPSWGEQICLKLDTPFNGVEYMAYLHIGYTEPSLKVGDHVDAGQVIGLSGGSTYPYLYEGKYQLFVNSPEMSSQPQTGIALMRGPVYGTGDGWNSISPDLNPQPIIDAVIKGVQAPEKNMGVPHGWHDNGSALVAPNGEPVVLGFRSYILEHEWPETSVPLEKEHGADPVLEYDRTKGEGDRQLFSDRMLIYTPKDGVELADIGREFQYVLQDRDNLRTQYTSMMKDVADIKSGLPKDQINAAITALQGAMDSLTNLVR